MSKQYTEDFKRNVGNYWEEHPKLGIGACAKKLGIGKSTLSHWRKEYEEYNGSVPTWGRGNFESDEAKKIARLRRQLRDT